MLRAAIALLLLAATAQAQPATKKAEAEAISFLTPCRQQPTKDRQEICELNQPNFVEQYVLAKSGDVSGMDSTAASFTPPSNEITSQTHIGMPRDQLQACAWRLVIAQSQRSTVNAALTDQMARDTCAPLSPVRFAAAEQRAGRLAQELRTSPAVAPSDDWCPRIPWIKTDCSAPPSQRPLTSTVTPLSGN